MWGVILALQSSGAVHLGVDNLGVVRHVGRLLDGSRGSVPWELVKDGDLLLLVDRMLRLRGLDTVRISKVKGHADEGMVLHGLVRESDRFGNSAADEAPSKCVFLSTSRVVRREMRDWFVTDEGTTFRGWSSTLAKRVRVVLARLLVVFALPLHFHGRLCVLRNMFIPGVLHGIEASFLAESSVRKLRAAFCRVSWSSRKPLAHVGAVLSLLDGPVGYDPAFCVVWFRFRQMRRYLAYRPEEVSRVYRLLAAAAAGGSSGHGPAHLLFESAAEIGFSWCSHVPGWNRPGLPVLSMVAGPIQHFRAAILAAWRHKVSVDLCSRKGFRGGPFLDVSGTMQLLNSDHVRERDKALLRGVLVGCVWNGFLLGKVKNCHVPCRFCGGDDSDGHLFWDCTFPPLVEIRENPELHELMEMDKSYWPRCLLWHGWLPMLSGSNGVSPWAGSASESAAYLVDVALGRYSSGLMSEWILSDDFDHDMAVSSLPDHPDVWTDGSLVLDRLTGVDACFGMEPRKLTTPTPALPT